MARVAERKLSWIPPLGTGILLSDYFNGYQVLEGFTGFDSPPYDHNEIIIPSVDGSTWLGARALSRDLFVPIKIWGPDRPTMLARKQALLASLNPQSGQLIAGQFNTGLLRVEDNGTSRSIGAFYVGGLEGDEGKDAAGRDWTTYGLKLRTIDAYWSESTPSSQVWTGGGAGSAKFFPIFPLKLGSSQILSGTGATIHNVVLNPSGEYGTTGWTGARDPGVVQPIPIVSRQTVTKQVGNYGGRVDWDAGTGEQWVEVDVNDLTNGVQYVVHVFLYCHGPDTIWFSVGNGHNIGLGTDTTATSFQDSWTQWVLRFTPGAFLPGVKLFLGKRGGSGGGFLIFDKLLISATTEQDYPNDVYIDGDQTNCVWEGTQGYSVSHRVPTFAPTPVQVVGDTPTWPIWYFAGPFTDITVRNNTTGRDFRFTLTVPAGSVLTLDTRPRRQSAVLRDSSGVATNVWPYLVDNDLFPLVLGNNDITLTVIGVDSNSSVNMSWYPQYMAAA